MAQVNLNEISLAAMQEELAEKISLSNRIALSEIKTISGVDLAFWKKDGCEYAVCGIDTIDYATRAVTETKHYIGEIKVPYKPGFLSFRELPLVLSTYALLEQKPDLLMFDGNGYLHDRHMGIATHAALELDTPAIGIAKSYLKISGVDYSMPENEAGAYMDIVIRGEVYGRVLRTHRDVKPIFVSCGNWIDLDTVTEITLSMVMPESRQPLPTRMADIVVRSLRSSLLLNQEGASI